MSYDDQYYFIRKDEANEHLPSLMPDTDTVARNYWYQPQPLTSPPFVFSNGWKKEFKERRIKELVAPILFDGSNFAVGDALREQLLRMAVPHLCLHPAIYIDDSGHWHEDYWYVSFAAHFTCWDLDKPICFGEPIEIGDERVYDVTTYTLDEQLLENTPLQDRLLFQMGGTSTDMIVCHESIAHLFQHDGGSGARLQPITQY